MTLQQDGTLKAGEEVNELLVQGGAHNRAAREIFAGSDIIITDSWNATVELYDYHRNMPNGLHECGKALSSDSLPWLCPLSIPCCYSIPMRYASMPAHYA